MKLGKYTLLGFFLDLVDWVIVGFVPVLGDGLDVLSILFWYWILKSPVALVGAIELVPLADVLPTNILLGLYADSKKGGKR